MVSYVVTFSLRLPEMLTLEQVEQMVQRALDHLPEDGTDAYDMEVTWAENEDYDDD